ncbi:WD40-repeat-containing domain protein [Thermoascus aurantiacus ATCC 26904]
MPGTLASQVEWAKVEKYLSAEVRYACYWVGHARQSEVDLCEDGGPVHHFLQKHLLHWLEALSLMKKVNEAMEVVETLNDMVMGRSETRLYLLVNNINKFIKNRRSTIETAPLQVYSSAIVFSPENSVIRNQFQDQVPSWMDKFPEVERNWRFIQTLHTYQDNSYRAMRTTAVSPDGKTLAVGSSHNDGNIQFWDLATGTLRKTLHGSSGSIKDMGFSHDGNSLATAWFDSTVRHYNPVTGELCAPEVFHTQRFLTMAYSSDDRLLIAECPGGVIQIRNPTAERLPSVLEGHIDRDIDNIDFPCPTAFSHDCFLLAYVSDLDTTTGKSIYTCPDTVGGERIMTLAFSPNGDILALGYLEGCLRIWNMLDGKSPVLHYDLGMITSVTFSSDGKYLAAATVRNTAWIWDLSSGKQYNFVEFPSWVVTMAFLPNGHLLTKTGDGAIRLWDPRLKFWMICERLAQERCLQLSHSPQAVIFSNQEREGFGIQQQEEYLLF